MQDFEKLGVFYLGRSYDLDSGNLQPNLLLYDSKDLVTHAVCVGMTGSGKTGLCLSLLEEAAIDGIPAIVIDPKGDLGNLLLTFPKLRGLDFAPWVNTQEASNQGLDAAEFARRQAEMWKKGLADWGQDGKRIQRLRQSAEFAIYTPGSTAGLPLSVLKTFTAPESAILDDAELFRDRVNASATSLLGLLGIQADPIQSKEHILLTNILNHAWKKGQDLSLGNLIQLIQSPPIKQVGVVDLDSFFPAQDRFGLAMRLNNLLASPGFEVWMQGQPLDIDSLLYTEAGKPRVSIVSIAHLTEAERMFVVSLLLNRMVSWVRSQPGTTSLRALLYMDEIFGYFPPVANPPSKQPLLTLLKQARAYGLGVVLATQNPVDLDYKGLSNCGTWFIGRLQTERDKARVLEGLEGASSGSGLKFDRGRMERTLAGLGKRIFLMNNVHDDEPIVFQVRWAMSYLRGPLTRNQIKQLMEGQTDSLSGPAAAKPLKQTKGAKSNSSRTADFPVLAPGVPQFFLPIRSPAPGDARLVYQPMLLACAGVYFSDRRMEVDSESELTYLAEFKARAVTIDWKRADQLDLDESELERKPEVDASFATVPSAAGKAKSYPAWQKSLTDHLYRNHKLEIFQSPQLKEYSRPGESEKDFRIRLQQTAREQRDLLAGKLRDKYGPKVAALQERIRKAEQSVSREAEQAKQSKFQTLISFGSTILGAFLGRKVASAGNVSKAATAMKSASRSAKESSDVGRAEENVKALQKRLAKLESRFQSEIDSLDDKIDPSTEKLKRMVVKPKKMNINVRLMALAWVPCWQEGNGISKPAWE